MKPTIGLTGGIASGKSTVAKMFRDDFAIPLIDADQLAREVVAKGTPGLAAVVEEFGPEVLQDNGELDRARLGEIVFADRAKRKTLEAIMHPRIAMTAMQRIAELQNDPAPYLIYEAALLIENGIHKMFPTLVVVAVDPEVQIARMQTRDGLSEDEALQRLDAQLPLADKIAVADHVIDNGASLEETRQQVAAVHAAIVEAA